MSIGSDDILAKDGATGESHAPVKCIVGGVGFVLFYLGITTTTDSEGKPESWLERLSKEVGARGENAFAMCSLIERPHAPAVSAEHCSPAYLTFRSRDTALITGYF
jgi:hypothetical protein